MTEVPKITAEEAAVLRLRCSTFPAAGGTVLVDHWRSLAEKGLLISEDSKPTNLGRAALAAFDADLANVSDEQRREIRRQAIEECCAAVSQPWEDTIRSEVQP